MALPFPRKTSPTLPSRSVSAWATSYTLTLYAIFSNYLKILLDSIKYLLDNEWKLHWRIKMKKLLIVVLFFSAITFCFAKGQRDSFEIGLGYHSITEKQTVEGIEVKTKVPSFAINFAGITFFTDTVGIGAYGNFLIPQKFELSAMGETLTVDRSAYDFLLGLDFLIGPAFMLYKSENFCLPLSVGLHLFQLWANTEIGNTKTNAFGLGTNITGEYHFNNVVYLYGRFQLSLDFYSWGKTEVYTGYGTASQSFSESLITWGINPCVGLGFKW